MSQDIDFTELLQILQKRKKLIVLLSLLFLIFGMLYLWQAKPLYEVRAMMEIGKFEAGTKDEQTLDNIHSIKQKLEYYYGVKSKKKKEYPIVKSIDIKKKAKDIFLVTVEGYDNKSAQNLINNMITKIQKEYSRKMNTYLNMKKELISLVEMDIKNTKENLNKVNAILKEYNQKLINLSQKDAALAGIYTIQISRNQEQLQALESRISLLKGKEYNLKLSITPSRIKDTHVIGEIEVLDHPVKPKKILIILVSFITGLIFSIFLAFFLEFLQGIRKK